MVAYRITARSLERQVVGDEVLKELASLEDCNSLPEPAPFELHASSKVVFILEEDEHTVAGAPRRPQ